MGDEAEARGIKQVLERYKRFFDLGITMHTSSTIEVVVESAAKYATWEMKHGAMSGKQVYYTILLILTDGDLQNIAKTKKEIVNASQTPLSIVIVGIGHGDFGDMRYLDDFSEQTYGNFTGRDIVQFVEFSAYKNSQHDLNRAVFEEIPDQLVEYFQSKGIMPNDPIEKDVEDIEVDPLEEHNSTDGPPAQPPRGTIQYVLSMACCF